MEEIKIIKEEITYKYNEKEQQEILKRTLDNNKYSLSSYWDYNDKLSNKQIIKIINKEDGLNDIENELYDGNDYICEEINKIIENELSDKEKTDEELVKVLGDNLKDNWDFNFKDIFNYSSIRIRLELNTNEDFGFLPEMRENKGDYLKNIKRAFKGVFKVKDLRDEINEFRGSD